VVVIDVSQSVEKEHPRALDFLRTDAHNVTDFFRRRAVTVMTPRELFDYAVHAGLPSQDDERAFVEAALARAEGRVGDDGEGKLHESAEAEVAHAVFMASHIPTALADVRDAEVEVAKLRAAGGVAGSDMYYATVTGTGIAGTGTRLGAAGAGVGGSVPAVAAAAADGDGEREGAAVGGDARRRGGGDDNGAGGRGGGGGGGSLADATADGREGGGDAGEGGDSDDSSSGSDGDGDGEEGEEVEGEGSAAAFTKKGATKEERKAHQAAVKAANREKRKTKLPKHVKKRSVKAGGKK
jgi:RIO kinase 1